MAQQKNNIYLILVAFIFFGCEEAHRKNSEFIISKGGSPLKIVEIDSCEYFFGDWNYSSVLTHKGNCKFCVERKTKWK